MFVEVPMTVRVPPSIEANESGMRSFDGEVLPLCARSATTGTRMATTGVLLMNPDTGPVTLMVAASCFVWLLPAYSAIFRPMCWTIPVRLTPVLKMSIANTVMVAGLAKPESPSCGVICVHGSSTIRRTITTMAVTSMGSHSVANKTRERKMSAKTTSISTVTAAGTSPWTADTSVEKNTSDGGDSEGKRLVSATAQNSRPDGTPPGFISVSLNTRYASENSVALYAP